MLIDTSVARSFAVSGWTRHLVAVCGGAVLVANGVHGEHADDPSELRNIRAAIQRQAEHAGLGTGLSSRALAAIQGLDELLSLSRDELTVLTLTSEELELAVQLQSRQPADRAWRRAGPGNAEPVAKAGKLAQSRKALVD